MGKKTAGGTGDKETDDVLAEMQEAGEELPKFAAGADVAEAQEEEAEDAEEEKSDADDADEDEDDDSDEEDEDEEEEKEEEKSEADDEDEDDDSDEGEGDGDEEDEDDEEAQGKKPVWKRLKEEKLKRKTAEALVLELQGKKSQEATDHAIESYAKKHKMNPAAAKELVELAASIAADKVGIDPKTRAQIQSAAKAEEGRKFWDRQNKLFDQEFVKNVAPLAQRDGQKANKLRASLHDLAFQPENANKSLVELYLGLQKPGKKITSESGRSDSRRQTAADLDDLSEINNLSDEDFDKASEALANKSKSKIIRRGGIVQ